MVTGVPWPAASNITPMMLLALISRPLAAMVTLQRNGARACTSLAVARACSPRRLLTVSSRSSIVDYRSITGARRGSGGQLIQSLFRIIHHPQQHRQAQRRYPANRGPQPGQLPGKVGGAGAVQVGQDQHAVTSFDPPQSGRGEREQGVQVCVERYFESFGFQRQLPQETGRHVKQGGPDPGMCYEENATGHYRTLTG